MERQRISSGSAFEERVGYSRAVRVGDRVLVAGTAPIMPGDADPPAGAYDQARVCLAIVERALAEAGATFDHVVPNAHLRDRPGAYRRGRTRARRGVLEARPATTGIVTGLLDPRWLVEIEVEAVILPP